MAFVLRTRTRYQDALPSITPMGIASARSMMSGLLASSADVTPRYGSIVRGLAAATSRVDVKAEN
jgi:hypothetical protein